MRSLSPIRGGLGASLLTLGLTLGCGGADGRSEFTLLATQRVQAGEIVSDGFLLAASAPHEVDVTLPERAVLRFATTCIDATASGESTGAEVALTVALDGREVAVIRRKASAGSNPERHVVDLAGHVGEARLSFALEGAVDLTVHNPVVHVRDAASERPDIIVFLADTFRADNMTVYGGEAGVTPHLDRFAKRSVVFKNTWAPSSWTLPSHASLFLGVHPFEHGATAIGRHASDKLPAFPEQVAAAGYRTGAITNGIFVSRAYEMDRGFEWFEERSSWELADTLKAANAFLQADDGRPTLLFIHSYRAHWPYRVTGETLRAHGERLELAEALRIQEEVFADLLTDPSEIPAFLRDADWDRLIREFVERLPDVDPEGVAARIASINAALHRAYLGAVADVDRSFGGLVNVLEQRGHFDNGYLVFTSDHGEAFGEHGALFHGRDVWDEVLRIPMVLRGPGLAPRVDETPASLLDLGQTVIQIADAKAIAGSRGGSLLGVSGDRPIFSFDCNPAEPLAAVIDDGWKLTLPSDPTRLDIGSARRLFHIAEDPGETRDLLDSSAQGAELLNRRHADLSESLRPRFDSEAAVLDEASRQRMRDVGYFGDTEGR